MSYARAVAAVDLAVDEAIKKEFLVLVANIGAENAHAPFAEDFARFRRGISLIRKAYDFAMDAVRGEFA